MTTAHINHSAGAIACILKYYDVVQLSLDMPDESAKGYTPGAKALLELSSSYETLHKKKKRSGDETRMGSTAAVARPLVF